jgi:hypothetical protein
MKSFNTLLAETRKTKSLDELESAHDLFDFGIDNYSVGQATRYNNLYWDKKNYFLTNRIHKKHPNLNYMKLYNIVIAAKPEIKNDEQKLINYINDRLKALKGNKRYILH